MRPLILALSLVGLAAGADDDYRLAYPLDGQPFPAKLVAIAPDWTIRLSAADGARSIAAADFARWGEYRDTYQDTHVYLTDQSLLVADVLEMDDKGLQLYGDVCGAVHLEFPEIRGMVFDPALASRDRDRRWDQIFSTTGVRDLLLFNNGDSITGDVRGMETTVNTSAEAVTSILLKTEGREIQIPLDKLAALVFNPMAVHRPRETREAATLGFSDGTLLHVSKMEDRRSLIDLQLVGGAVLHLDPKLLVDELELVLPDSNRIEYLSDRPSLAYKHVPMLELTWPLGRDRSVTGGFLRSGNQVFLKGLGMHATARVAATVPKGVSQFQAEVALDDSAGYQGSVIFRVFLQNENGTWQPAYASPVIRGPDPPLHLAVDVAGARSLALIVDAADRGDILDHANWLYPRLIKPSP